MVRAKTCKVCKTKFQPTRPIQPCCGYECSVTYGIAVAAKNTARKAREAAKEHREAKVKAKTKAQWMKEAQSAVNAYVRVRDYHLGCVSCDKPASWGGQWHASHYRSVGAASSIRFNLFNIHKSCSVCNNWKSGNLIDYDERLREKIGNDKVDWLRSQNSPRPYTIEYLEKMRNTFRKKTARLKKKNGIM